MFPLFFLGKVSDNCDPESLNRIKVTKIGEEEMVTDWIPMLTAYGGADTGLSLLPDVDDQVLVLSSGTDGSRLVALGGLWSNDFTPPASEENADADFNGDGENNLKFLKTRSGNMMIFDDTEGKEKMQIISSDSASRFEFLAEDEMISLTTENDIMISAKGALTLQAEEIDITAEKQANVSAEEFQVKAKKNAEYTSDKDITVKGSGIALN